MDKHAHIFIYTDINNPAERMGKDEAGTGQGREEKGGYLAL